jgi:hypothetical protein
MAESGNLWRIVGREPWSGIEDDLRRFHRGGGAGYWLLSDTPLNTISKLKTVQVRVRRGPDPDSLPDAVRGAIEEAIECVERSHRCAASTLLGFSGARKESYTPREEAAAKAFGYKDGSSYRRPQKRLTKDGRARSQLDVTIEQVAIKLAELEAEAVAAEDDAARSSSALDKGLNERSTLEALAAGWSSLPPLAIRKLTPLLGADLDEELRKVLAHLYHAFGRVGEQQTFVSWSTALELRRRHYDPDDSVYVLSRRDSKPGFRDQEGWSAYVESLRSRRHPVDMPAIWQHRRREQETVGKGQECGINQLRIVIADDVDAAIDSVSDIRDLHRSGTLFYLPQTQLQRYEYLRDLRFGLLISTRHRYAMISVPAPTSAHTSSSDISHFVKDHNLIDDDDRYKPTAGEMRAVITADVEYVERLILDFEKMLASPDSTCLPSGAELFAPDGSELQVAQDG